MLWLSMLACSMEGKEIEQIFPEIEEAAERNFPARIWRQNDKQYRNVQQARNQRPPVNGHQSHCQPVAKEMFTIPRRLKPTVKVLTPRKRLGS